jgi:hypothetical protein
MNSHHCVKYKQIKGGTRARGQGSRDDWMTRAPRCQVK